MSEGEMSWRQGGEGREVKRALDCRIATKKEREKRKIDR